MDPVVSTIDAHILVVDGTYSFLDDDPCAVEVHCTDGVATACEPMSDAFRGLASTTFLFVAAFDKKMYVMEKTTRLTCSLDVEVGAWGATTLLRLDSSLFSSITFSIDRLILVGLGQDGKNAVTLKMWMVDCDTFECGEVGAMSGEMLDISVVGDFANLCNPSEPAVSISCDFTREVGGVQVDRGPSIDGGRREPNGEVIVHLLGGGNGGSLTGDGLEHAAIGIYDVGNFLASVW